MVTLSTWSQPWSSVFCAQKRPLHSAAPSNAAAAGVGRPAGSRAAAVPLQTASPFVDLRHAPVPLWASPAHTRAHAQFASPTARSCLVLHAKRVVCPGPIPRLAAADIWAQPLELRNPSRRYVVASTSALGTAPTSAAGAGPKPTHRRRQQQQRRPGQSKIHTVQEDAVLFVGFHPEELDVVWQRLPELLPLADLGDGGAAVDGATTVLVDVKYDMLQYTVTEILSHRVAAAAADAGGSGGTAVAAGRVVLLVGQAARKLGAQLNDLLPEWGVVPALIAAYQPKHEGMLLRQLVAFLRDSHAAYYGLLQPLRVEPIPEPAVAAAAAAAPQAAAAAAAVGAAPEAESDVAAEAQTASTGVDQLAVLEEVRVVLCAAMDAGEVPSMQGEYRRDAGHVVVLDGLLTEAERTQLLGWLTAPGHDHGGPPPGDKWELVCVDREGERPTWGLQPEMLAALRDDPPPPVVALQSRLAALYPEYDICHMPADQISGEPADDGDATPLSSFVGNAVMAGDPCAWHVDADPTTVPPHSPWVHNFGYYHNRELGRPLFVSMLLYLNKAWPEDYHAETLFLDPEAQLGLFVRPAPGRVVLLEQDLPHRISSPSREAPGPRYSLVWKLVLVPKAGRGRDEAAAGARGNQQAGPGEEEGGERGCDGGGDVPRGVGEEAGGCVAAGGEFQSICRPEWGEPVRIGSASSRCGVPAFQRRPPGSGGSDA